MWVRHHHTTHSSIDCIGTVDTIAIRRWWRFTSIGTMWVLAGGNDQIWWAAAGHGRWWARTMIPVGCGSRTWHVDHCALKRKTKWIIQTQTVDFRILPEELGLGLTQEEWGDSCVVCSRLESCVAYGEDAFNGNDTGICDIPDDSPVGVDCQNNN